MSSDTTPWIKKFEEAIEESKLIPLWGAPPPFPWKEFTQALSNALSLPKLQVQVEKTEWKKAENFLVGLGQKPHVSCIDLAPLSNSAFVAISSEDLDKLSTACLTKTQDQRGFSHPDFQEGFFHFLLLEALNVADKLKCFSDLSARLGKPASLHKDEGGFCYDVRINLGQEIVRLRLICPSAFHQAFRAHFSINKLTLTEIPFARELFLPVHIEIGSSSLDLKKWKSVNIGDLVILDRCSFDPILHKGSVTLALGKTPLFRGKLKEGNLKILDYAFYYEESMSPSDDENEFREVPGEEESETPEGPMDKSTDLPPDEISEEGEHLWSPKENQDTSMEKLLSAQEVPLTLTVEIGRLTLSLEKLMQMKPGNLLELGLNPDQGVHLTLQGKRVARGELVKIGDLLGVRILELPES